MTAIPSQTPTITSIDLGNIILAAGIVVIVTVIIGVVIVWYFKNKD